LVGKDGDHYGVAQEGGGAENGTEDNRPLSNLSRELILQAKAKLASSRPNINRAGGELPQVDGLSCEGHKDHGREA
jgi:hypothetical protein